MKNWIDRVDKTVFKSLQKRQTNNPITGKQHNLSLLLITSFSSILDFHLRLNNPFFVGATGKLCSEFVEMSPYLEEIVS